MKKYKIILNIVMLLCMMLVQGQVGIGTTTPHASTALDIVATNKGFSGPNVTLSNVNTATITLPTDGLLVYNTNAAVTGGDGAGWYFWYNSKWNPMGNTLRNYIVSNGKMKSILGYEAIGEAPASNVGQTITLGANTYTNMGCKQWTTGTGANNHWYCAYNVNNGIDWETAFNFGKSLKGYLVTMTNTNEVDWVRTNIINNGTGYNLANPIWLGYNKLTVPGNPIELVWITGEQSRINWMVNPASLEGNWSSGEPNNSGGNEGCALVATGGIRPWRDVACTSITSGTAINKLIIEFELPE